MINADTIREAIVKALAQQLRQGAKGLVGNRGFRRFLKVDTQAVSLDQAKVTAEARLDGKYGLRTHTEVDRRRGASPRGLRITSPG